MISSALITGDADTSKWVIRPVGAVIVSGSALGGRLGEEGHDQQQTKICGQHVMRLAAGERGQDRAGDFDGARRRKAEVGAAVDCVTHDPQQLWRHTGPDRCA